MLSALLAALATLLAARWWMLVLCAGAHLLRRLPDIPEAVPLDVELLVPAYNEARVLEATVRSALASDHARLRVVIIDDGSTDGTGALAAQLAAEHDRVEAILQPANGGKAAALQAAVAASRADVLVTVDADTVVAPTAVRALAARLLDPRVDAVAGNVKVGNRDRPLTRWQHVEYVTALHIDRRALDVLDCITTVPGAAGAWRRSSVVRAGGWSSDTRTEDTDLTLAMLRQGAHIVFEPRAEAFTEAPGTLGDLIRQRARWMFGYLQCLAKHRAAFFRPTVLGWFGMPNLFYAHFAVFVLPVFGWLTADQVVATAGTRPLWTGLSLFLAGELVLSGWALWVDGESLADLTAVPAQRLAWPVLLYVTFARVWGRVLTAREVPWWSPERQGALADHTVGGGEGAVR